MLPGVSLICKVLLGRFNGMLIVIVFPLAAAKRTELAPAAAVIVTAESSRPGPSLRSMGAARAGPHGLPMAWPLPSTMEFVPL